MNHLGFIARAIAVSIFFGGVTASCFAGDIERIRENHLKLKADESFSYECIVNTNDVIPYTSEWAMSQLPEEIRKETIKQKSKENRKKSFLHIQEKGRFYQQAYNPERNITFDMGWYFDGKKTHIITGIAISNGKIIQINRKISDNVKIGWHPVFVDPISVTLGFSKLMESDSLSKFTKKSENIYTYDSTNGIDRELLLGFEKAELEIGNNALRDVIRYSNTTKERDISYRISEFSVFGKYRLPSKYEFFIVDNNVKKMRRTYDVISLTEMKNKKFFEELNALNIADVYDQDTQKKYKLNNKMSFFTRLIDSKAIFGSIFVISFVTILVFVYKKFKK